MVNIWHLEEANPINIQHAQRKHDDQGYLLSTRKSRGVNRLEREREDDDVGSKGDTAVGVPVTPRVYAGAGDDRAVPKVVDRRALDYGCDCGGHHEG